MINKKVINGIKGVTVCYVIPNFNYDTTNNKLTWDAFKFYTPLGNQTDTEGMNYFDVPAEDIVIDRDPILDKEIIICITQNSGVEIYEIYEGATMSPLLIGLEGDIVATGIFPATVQSDINIIYKEVING